MLYYTRTCPHTYSCNVYLPFNSKMDYGFIKNDYLIYLNNIATYLIFLTAIKTYVIHWPIIQTLALQNKYICLLLF